MQIEKKVTSTSARGIKDKHIKISRYSSNTFWNMDRSWPMFKFEELWELNNLDAATYCPAPWQPTGWCRRFVAGSRSTSAGHMAAASAEKIRKSQVVVRQRYRRHRASKEETFWTRSIYHCAHQRVTSMNIRLFIAWFANMNIYIWIFKTNSVLYLFNISLEYISHVSVRQPCKPLSQVNF